MPRSRLTTIVLATSLSVVTLASPAFAKTKPVVVPASVFANEDSKLCMPRTALSALVDKKTLKTMPETICETKTDWESRGLEFKLK
ncbi:MAG: hypothetical protein OSB00_19090 [Sphingomonas bacterium]|nr:hypothetical protein [Sphingomonas bacterium]